MWCNAMQINYGHLGSSDEGRSSRSLSLLMPISLGPAAVVISVSVSRYLTLREFAELQTASSSIALASTVAVEHDNSALDGTGDGKVFLYDVLGQLFISTVQAPGP